jgi:hypothetical protein
VAISEPVALTALAHWRWGDGAQRRGYQTENQQNKNALSDFFRQGVLRETNF